MTHKHEHVCFVISPIGEAESETRKRSDQILKHVIRPAVESCGYIAKRADELDKPGIITSQVIQHIVNDPLVIADLTERNPNVFYELAIRHALRKPLVQIIKKGETIPFDVAGMRTISVDHQDLDSVASAKEDIIRQVKELQKTPDAMETPISVSIELQTLRQSDKPEERSLADLVAAVSDLRSNFTSLETKLGTKDQVGILDEVLKRVEMLPRILDEYNNSPRTTRRGMMHPIMLREFSHILPESSPAIEILFAASLFKDIAPWIHELGLEAYRSIMHGTDAQAQKALLQFQKILRYTLHSPMARDLLGKNKEAFMLAEEIEPFLSNALHRMSVQTHKAKTK